MRGSGEGQPCKLALAIRSPDMQHTPYDVGREEPLRLHPGQPPQRHPYTGVTSNLVQRISLHKQDLIAGFTKTYGVHMLVYYEMHFLMDKAIRREKQIKEWRRLWKIRLIESFNPEWLDLFDDNTGEISEGPEDAVRRKS
jgi:putative endonuclease